MNVFANPGKMDARLGRLALSAKAVSPVDANLLQKSPAGYAVQAIITFDGDIDAIRRAGGTVILHRGDMAIISLPLSRLEEISDLPAVKYMEAPEVSKPLLNVSTVSIEAVKAREQLGATGKNVIIGIIDSGIDWQHRDFRHVDGSTRIKYLLDVSEAGPIYTGTVYTEAQINAALAGNGRVNETDVSGHGTHVVGIAAGDGGESTSFGAYAGVAPEADIVAVKATRDVEGRTFFTIDQILALAFIDSVAGVLGKPWVANLSLGGQGGGHDGSSPVERFIDNLTGPGIAGKVVVTVAGNDGDVDNHAQASIASSTDKPVISCTIDPYVPNAGSGNDVLEFDGWYDGAKKIGVTLISPSGKRYGPVLPSQVFPSSGAASHPTDEGDIYIWNGFYFNDNGGDGQPGVNPYNGDREFRVEISDASARRPAVGEWRLEFSGTGGDIDVWISNATMIAYFVDGNASDGKLAIPGTARHAITVGSYITKKNWQDLDGNRLTFDGQGLYEQGDLSVFSSPGPVRTGAYQKPDITAPGQILVSTLSVDAPSTSPTSVFYAGDARYPNALVNEDGYHGLNSGTSMAAPHVTGAVALILQKHPELSAIQVRDILQKAAEADRFVGATPNFSWGWGKLNIYEALLQEPAEEPPVILTFKLPMPNPFVNSTRIDFELPALENMERTQIVIYNALGRRVRTLVNETKSSGPHSAYWDGRDAEGSPVGSGVYFIRLKFGGYTKVRKVVFLGVEK